MSLTRADTVGDWIAAAQAEGFPETDGCAFYAWADGREADVLTALELAPSDAILAASVTALRMTACADRAWFVALVEEHSDSAAVIRWARNAGD